MKPEDLETLCHGGDITNTTLGNIVAKLDADVRDKIKHTSLKQQQKLNKTLEKIDKDAETSQRTMDKHIREIERELKSLSPPGSPRLGSCPGSPRHMQSLSQSLGQMTSSSVSPRSPRRLVYVDSSNARQPCKPLNIESEAEWEAELEKQDRPVLSTLEARCRTPLADQENVPFRALSKSLGSTDLRKLCLAKHRSSPLSTARASPMTQRRNASLPRQGSVERVKTRLLPRENSPQVVIRIPTADDTEERSVTPTPDDIDELDNSLSLLELPGQNPRAGRQPRYDRQTRFDLTRRSRSLHSPVGLQRLDTPMPRQRSVSPARKYLPPIPGSYKKRMYKEAEFGAFEESEEMTLVGRDTDV